MKSKSRVFALGAFCLTLPLAGFEPVLAKGPQQELGSGIYETLVIESVRSQESRTDLSVGEFSPRLHDKVSGITDQIFFECASGTGLIGIGDLAGFSDYIRSAFIEQLQVNGSYVTEAPVRVSGNLQKVDLYFDSLVGESSSQGTWSIQLALRSSLGREESFSINHTYPIQSQSSYCHVMANQFMASVQALMLEIFQSGKFDRLVSTAGTTSRQIP